MKTILNTQIIDTSIDLEFEAPSDIQVVAFNRFFDQVKSFSAKFSWGKTFCDYHPEGTIITFTRVNGTNIPIRNHLPAISICIETNFGEFHTSGVYPSKEYHFDIIEHCDEGRIVVRNHFGTFDITPLKNEMFVGRQIIEDFNVPHLPYGPTYLCDKHTRHMPSNLIYIAVTL